MRRTVSEGPSEPLPVPEGYAERPIGGPFTRRNGPFYTKTGETGRAALGFRVEERHLNGFGVLHGGMMAAFADSLCATAARMETGKRSVTLRLATDFLAPAHDGDWVEGTASVLRATRSLVFVEGEGAVGGRAIFRVAAVFKILERH